MARSLAILALSGLLIAGVLSAPHISTKTLTTTGISAGGAMAVQYEIANSATVRAAGVIAGIPWYCAQMSGLATAMECMSDPSTINVATLGWEMNVSATEGNIDPIGNLKSHAVMLFSGIWDTVVNHGTMELLATQYQSLGVAELRKYFNYSAEHAWITNFYGESCSHLGSPFINNCGLDFAGEFLQFAWAHMGLTFNTSRGTYVPGNLQTFSQTDFGADAFTNSLDSTGYYYVPSACGSDAPGDVTCHVHVNFHGCEQQRASLGDLYVAHTGLNEWAESNNVIVIYPQAAANALSENPNACFDWWGYTGSHYADKYGPQVAFANAVVARLMTTGSLPPAGWKKQN